MSDFLHNLRNGNVGNRFDRPRKNYDNSQYRSGDRHTGRDKRNGHQKKPYPGEQLTIIKKILEEIQESQKELVKAARERTVSERRMADALEAIAGHLGRPAAPTTPDPADTAPETQPEESAFSAASGPEPAAEASPDRREAALAVIRPLRDQGLTYEKIARQLETQGVPTVSGRGKWRGQAVSKLLTEV